MADLSREIALLTEEERAAYNRYLEQGKPPLAASTSAKFFQLYLQGHSTQEIAKLFPAFGLGMIVRSRVEDGWDAQRDAHLQNLLGNIRQVAQKTQLEAVRFVADGLAVFQRLAGEKFQRYLQSGDVKDLGEYEGISFKQYKELLELLLKLTGQDSTKKVSGDVLHRHVVEESSQPITVRANRPMTSTEAEVLLERLDTGPKVKK